MAFSDRLTDVSEADSTRGLRGLELGRDGIYRIVLGAGMALMLGLSWPLWVREGAFPQVPFVPGLPVISDPWAWVRFASLVGLVLAGIRWPRIWLAAVGILTWMVLEDQHRFQPWAYQFGLCALAMALLPAAQAIACARVLAVAIYVHSGLSKLDVTFGRELGPLFLSVIVRPFGENPWAWDSGLRMAASLTMPLGELLVGLALIPKISRPWAVGGLVVVHGLLILILGPWFGLGHSTIVLVWNGLMLAQGVILFGGVGDAWGALREGVRRPVAAAVLGVISLAALMPLGERWGVWDTWPSFALYASHAERVSIFVQESELSFYPEEIQAHLSVLDEPLGTGWHRLDLTSWSRATRGTPSYPQARASIGVAEALAGWDGAPRRVRVVWWSRADRWSGRRRRVEATGLVPIQRLADRFRLNGHPRKPVR